MKIKDILLFKNKESKTIDHYKDYMCTIWRERKKSFERSKYRERKRINIMSLTKKLFNKEDR